MRPNTPYKWVVTVMYWCAEVWLVYSWLLRIHSLSCWFETVFFHQSSTASYRKQLLYHNFLKLHQRMEWFTEHSMSAAARWSGPIEIECGTKSYIVIIIIQRPNFTIWSCRNWMFIINGNSHYNSITVCLTNSWPFGTPPLCVVGNGVVIWYQGDMSPFCPCHHPCQCCLSWT